jgi:hypothetical protein
MSNINYDEIRYKGVTGSAPLQTVVDAVGTGLSSFIAEGAIAQGSPVILTAEGKIQAVGGGAISASLTSSVSEWMDGGSAPLRNQIAFDPNNPDTFLLVWESHNSRVYCKVGQISNDIITWSDTTTVTTDMAMNVDIDFDAETPGQFIISYFNDLQYDRPYMKIGTLSGTSVSLSDAIEISSSAMLSSWDGTMGLKFLPGEANKFVVCYAESSYGKVKVGTISGSSVSFGSEYNFNQYTADYVSLLVDPNTPNKFVIIYEDKGTYANPPGNNEATAIVGTISGTSISFGTETKFVTRIQNTGNTVQYMLAAFDPSIAGQFYVCYKNRISGSSSYGDGEAIIGNIVNGDDLTFSDSYQFGNGPTDFDIATDPNVPGQFMIVGRDGDDVKAHVGQAAGGVITWQEELSLNPVQSTGAQPTYLNDEYDIRESDIKFFPNAANKFLWVGYDGKGDNEGLAMIGQAAVSYEDGRDGTTNLTADNFIGFAETAISNGMSGQVVTDGVSTKQAGLTAGLEYHVKSDGTLSNIADDGSVKLGKALSSTDLQIDTSGSSSSSDHEFVASGTLPNGIAVMLKSDGTVEAVSETTTNFTGAGSEFVYRSTDGVSETVWYSEGDYQAIEFDPNNPNNFILAYTKVSSQGYLYVVAGTVSGTDITFGSEELVYNGTSGHISIAFNPYSAGQFVIAWNCASIAGYSRGGKVTGSSITLGTTTATIRSQPCKFNVVIFNPYTNNGNGEHFVITSSGYGKIYKCTMDGAHNVTVGQHGNIPVNTSWYHCGIHHVSAAFDPNVADRIVIAYTTDGGGYGNPKVIVGMTNTNAPSFNQNMVEYNNANAKYSSMAFFPDNDDKFVVCFSDDGNSNHGSWIIGETLSNNQVGVGSTKSVFNAGAVTDIKFEFEGDGSDKCVVNYVNASGEAVMRPGTYSGTTITFGDEVVISTNVSRTAVAHDPNTSGQMVVAFADGGNNDYGTAVVVGVDQQITSTTMDADKFIGMSTSTYADGEDAIVTLKGGISTNQVGLTPGETYHVLDDGSLSTTPTATSAEVGMALSPTAILLKHL